MHEAIDIDDNCNIYGKDRPILRLDSASTTSKITQQDNKDRANEAKEMVELIMKRMSEVFRPQPPKPIKCKNCGGDHPTIFCLPKHNFQAYKPLPKVDKWCNFEKKWTNHETQECYNKIRHLREQEIAQNPQGGGNQALAYAPRGINQNYGQLGGGELAQPILGNQPPLPGTTIVRYIQPKEVNQESALVLVEHYGGEVRDMYMGPTSSYETVNKPSNIIPKGRYQMD